MDSYAKDHPLASNACDWTHEEIEAYPTVVVRDSSKLMAPRTIGWTRQNKLITVPTILLGLVLVRIERLSWADLLRAARGLKDVAGGGRIEVEARPAEEPS